MAYKGRVGAKFRQVLAQSSDGPSMANILMLGDGYSARDQGEFWNHVDQIISAIKTEDWYDERLRLNVFANDVYSRDPGACVANGCDAPIEVTTYFSATYAGGGSCKLLQGDSDLAELRAEEIAEREGKYRDFFHIVAILVNHQRFGGSANAGVAWTAAKHSEAFGIILHEIGHLFGLEDEYSDGTFQEQLKSPVGLNVATWKELVAGYKWSPGSTRPTMINEDCTMIDQSPLPADVPPETVGAFEGAARANCGRFRPCYACRMRDVTQPFCAVCKDLLIASLTLAADPTLTSPRPHTHPARR